MNQFRPIAAMLAAIALFAFYLLDVNQVERGVLRELQSQQVLFNDPTRAVAIEFDNEKGFIRLERESVGASWRIVEPKTGNADNAIINAYLENLRGARRQARFGAKNLEQYGLATPNRAVRITFDTDEGVKTHEVLFGVQPARFGNVYTKIAGEDEVFTVSEWFYRQSGKSLEDVRDRAVVQINPSTVLEYRIETRRSLFTVDRKSETTAEWTLRLQGRQPIPADRSVIERLQMSLGQGTFLRLYDDPTTSTEELGFTDPALRLEMDGEEALVLGKPLPGREQFYARGSAGRIGAVSAGLFADFFRQPLEWGTKRMVWMPTSSIQEIRTSTGTSVMNLLRTDEGWKFESMPDVLVRQDEVEHLLAALADFRAVSLIDADIPEDKIAEYGLFDESYRLIAKGADGESQGFRFGRTDSREGVTYTLREQDNSLWLINVRSQSGVYKITRDLIESRLVPDLVERAKRFAVETPDGTVVGEKQASMWSITLPNTPPALVQRAQVLPLLAAFQDLETESTMYTRDHLPPIFTISFHDEDDELLFEGSLVDRKQTGVFFRIDNRRVEVSARKFEVFDSELARLLLTAKATLERNQK